MLRPYLPITISLFFLYTGLLQAQSPLNIELIVPISNPSGERIIALDRYPRLYVRISNQSQQIQRVWKDWNSWGWFNLHLEMTTQSGQTIMIRRKRPSNWDGDFSDFWLLKAAESVILEVDMSTAQWTGFPDLYGELLPASLKAIYENKSDILAQEFQVWVGKLESESLEVVFR